MTKEKAAVEAIKRHIDYQFGAFREYMFTKGYEGSLQTAAENIKNDPAVREYFEREGKE